MNHKKYKKQYFSVKNAGLKWASKESITTAPAWCSVDLRDGNQSIIVPMSLAQKLEFFSLLVKIGFKEIEVGFPAASDTEFRFVRQLIENDLIPKGVTIQVLTQAREHIVKRSFEALEGCNSAIVHVYNSTSKVQREQVFRKSKDKIKEIATTGAKLLVEYAAKTKGNFRFEYSPESFTGTENEFALDVCNSVLDIFKPTKGKKAIINLPATVENSMPHIFANKIEWFSDNLSFRDSVLLSLHNHNDRGTAVAATELGLLAGADRVEGTLFGNGERTGNTDIITMAMNLYSLGVNPKLDFSNMDELVSVYEKCTGLKVYERSPYSGSLVFSAFSGSHQDAIAKGLEYSKGSEPWTIPYLPIDPADVGRKLETCVIRINSQSGKGGASYILERLGYHLPIQMRQVVSEKIKAVSDYETRELSPADVEKIFLDGFNNNFSPLDVNKYIFAPDGKSGIFDIVDAGKFSTIKGKGEGRLDSFVDALENYLSVKFTDLDYCQHAIGTGSKAQAISYICVKANGEQLYGVGTNSDVTISAMAAMLSAVNSRVLS